MDHFLLKNSALFILVLSSYLTSTSSYSKSSSAATNNKLTNEPNGIISFDKPFIDFGSVKRGQKLSAKFQFKNIGKGELVIQGVQSACDCTTVDAAKGKKFAAGESGTIEVLLDTRDYTGKIVKALTVITNERSMPDRTLTLTALINSDVDATPPLADFGDVIVGHSSKKIVTIKNNMKNELKLEKLQYNDEFLEVTQVKENSEVKIEITLRPSVPIGFFKDTIWVRNNSTALPDLPIPIRASIRGPISSTPTYLEFGSIAPSEKSTRLISLTSTESFQITGKVLELNINGAKATEADQMLKFEVAANEKLGKKVNIELTNPGNKSGSVHGKVELQTNNAVQKNIIVDFYAFFR